MAGKKEKIEKKWYAVHTLSGQEKKAKILLEARIREQKMEKYFGEIVVPMETVAEVVDGKKRQVTRRAMPGYIFVQMHLNEETWHLVTGTDKITGFVGDRKRPRPMKDSEVKRILSQIREETTKVKVAQKFEVGQTVRVIDGPFASFTGVVDEVKEDKQKVRVLVTIFGRATPVELDFMQVEKV